YSGEDDFDEDEFVDRHMSDMMRRIIITDADRSFRENMEKYRSGMTGEPEQAMLEAVTRSFMMNRKYWISAKKNGDPMTRQIDGKTYVILYTEPETAEQDGVRKPVMTSSAEMMMYSDRQRKHIHFLIDPLPGSDGFIFRIETIREKLQELMTELTNQIIEEHELELRDHVKDPGIDKDDIPF
ncbi:MAG: hypothetical protein Q4D46_09410, partial [Erysipelotrichaceae bacterium]|nr:hypothetical protein [Erysipelotrichaceae bacterium]